MLLPQTRDNNYMDIKGIGKILDFKTVYYKTCLYIKHVHVQVDPKITIRKHYQYITEYYNNW